MIQGQSVNLRGAPGARWTAQEHAAAGPGARVRAHEPVRQKLDREPGAANGDRTLRRRAESAWARTRALGRPLVLAGLALLLGRAQITGGIDPFGIAYFAILTEVCGPRRSWPGWFVILGAGLAGGGQGAAVCAAATVVYRLFRRIVSPSRTPDIHWMPFVAGFAAVAVHLASRWSLWTRYDVAMAFADGALVIILALIWIQCMPLFVGRDGSRALRTEQLVSMAIFAGSVVAGLEGLSVRGMPLALAAIDGLVLLLAASGGAAAAATVAVVVGVLAILSHSMTLPLVAILAFTGLLAGVIKEAGRFWMSLAFLVSTGLLTVSSGEDWTKVEGVLLAAAAGALAFLLLPRRAVRRVAEYVPGTAEHRESEQERARRIRGLLSDKIHEVGDVFDELSAVFADTGDNPLASARKLLDHIIGNAANHVCTGCPRRKRCWEQEGYATYQSMVHTVTKLESSPSGHTGPSRDLRERCIRLDPMMNTLRSGLEVTRRDAQWMAKLREQRGLVAGQLAGVAGVVRAIADELERGNESSLSGEEQVLAALQQLGLYVDHVHIVSLEPGKVEVEVTQPSQGAYENSVRVIAPLLSGIVGEHISVSRVTGGEDGPCTTVFSSARLYDVRTAVATLTRDGRMVSGDTYTSVDLGNGRYAIAVSDGMGNGERARRESKAAIELLKKLLKAGFDEQLAIQTVNSTLLLRSRDEMFTTLDMALIDLFTARAEFLKIGSAPSYLKRGRSVRVITGSNVPIGILQDIEVQSIEEQLCDGDILILLSDGIFDAPKQAVDKEAWLKEQVERLETDDPQAIADTLIEAAAREAGGEIRDDMTVLVAVVARHQPEWAAIKVPWVTGLRKHARRAEGVKSGRRGA
ncbi:MAG: stage II sporulation protein E [Alicyclobacillus sp.]|nr:stage II sporulation protein E [Alicyclobacillus sp.]